MQPPCFSPTPPISTNLLTLPATAGAEGGSHVIVEMPKGSRNKVAHDPKTALFMRKSVLPEGGSLPYNSGSVPAATGEDDDPLDMPVLTDAPAFAGCRLEARLLGVIEAGQAEAGTTERGDRLAAVAATARQHQRLRELTDLPT